MIKGIVIICDPEFRITGIQYNGFGSSYTGRVGMFFTDYCNSEDVEKAISFHKEIQMEGVAVGWEINILLANQLYPLKFSGGRLDDQFLIFGVDSIGEIPLLCEEMMEINTEQSNYIRMLQKEKTQTEFQLKDSNQLYAESMALNNELANLQRELVKKNSELNRLNEQKNRFLGIAAHDLRSPLVNITYFMRFIMGEKERLSEKQVQYVQMVERSSGHLLQMINDLLDVSAIENGNINLEIGNHDLSELLTETIELNSAMAEMKRIHVKVTVPPEPLVLNFDKEKIRQVIVNIFSNAVKFTHSEKKIDIQLISDEKNAILEIADQGAGISKSEQKLLFEPFHQTSVKATEGEKGTGLGLSIVKNIIEEHKGEIGLDSEPGKGTKFSFSLPLP